MGIIDFNIHIEVLIVSAHFTVSCFTTLSAVIQAEMHYRELCVNFRPPTTADTLSPPVISIAGDTFKSPPPAETSSDVVFTSTLPARSEGGV